MSAVNAVDHDGDTALLYAISKGHLDIAELLLRHGADPNIAGDSGYPIRTAASRGWTQMVRALLVRGAIVDAPKGPELHATGPVATPEIQSGARVAR